MVLLWHIIMWVRTPDADMSSHPLHSGGRGGCVLNTDGSHSWGGCGSVKAKFPGTSARTTPWKWPTTTAPKLTPFLRMVCGGHFVPTLSFHKLTPKAGSQVGPIDWQNLCPTLASQFKAGRRWRNCLLSVCFYLGKAGPIAQGSTTM